MPSRALAVAVGAAVLLVAVVAVDAAVNRTYHLEAYLDGRWVKLGSHPSAYDVAMPSYVAFDLNASDVVPFRVSAENGYPWGLSKDVEVSAQGVLLHTGTLTAEARGTGAATFDVPASRLLSHAGPERGGPPGEPLWTWWLSVRVGVESFQGHLGVREVER